MIFGGVGRRGRPGRGGAEAGPFPGGGGGARGAARDARWCFDSEKLNDEWPWRAPAAGALQDFVVIEVKITVQG